MWVRMVCAAVVVAVVAPLSVGQTPVGTAFTYQGRLVENGMPAEGRYDFNFSLYDALEGGNQVGATVSLSRVLVAHGLFATALDIRRSVHGGRSVVGG